MDDHSPAGPGHDRWPWGLRSGGPVTVLAHRGGAGSHPENSLGAFADALRAGADGVELDARRTADGVVVVHHDAALADGRLVAAVAAADLPHEVPDLVTALAVCAGAVVDVEIKSSPAEPDYDPDETLSAQVAELVASVAAAADGPSAVIVTSFWPAALAAVRRRRPELATGLLVHPSLDTAAALDEAVALGCTTVLPFRARVTEALVTDAHRHGLAVAVWTVNDDADLRTAMSAGADAVVTDQVARALDVLGRR